jgi:hypothetical protein
MQGMKRAFLGLVVALMVAVSLSAGYLVGVGGNGHQVISTQSVTIKQSVTTTTTLATFQACSSPYSASIIRGTQSNTSVVILATNSTGLICADIENPTSDVTISYPYPSATVWSVKNGQWVWSANLNVTIHPYPFQSLPNSTSWYVFQVIPLNMTQAIYLVGLPTPCDRWVMVGVGYSVTNLQHSVLNLPDIMMSCPAAFVLSTVVGITNLIPTYSE